MDPVPLTISPREITGKKVKNLRKQGITPLHLYGNGGPPVFAQAEFRLVRTAVNKAGRAQPLEITVDGGNGEKTLAFVRDIAKHAVTGELQHVDFIRVDEHTPVRAEIPISFYGEAPGVRGGGGQFARGLRSVVVSALPLHVPNNLDVDISVLRYVGSNIRVEDLKLPEGVEPLNPPDAVVCRIAQTRTSALAAIGGLPEDELLEEGEEGEEGAEGEGDSSEEEEE